jgi:hypothetical protein
MMSIPALAEADLRHTIEGDFGIPVTLISPDGVRTDTATDGRPLVGKVRWSQPEINAEGMPVVVDNPVVTLRRSSLPREPKSREAWAVIIPSGPRADAPLAEYLLDKGYAVEGGRTLGKIRLPLVRVKQPGLHLTFEIQDGVLRYRTSDPLIRFKVENGNLYYSGPRQLEFKIENGHLFWRRANV